MKARHIAALFFVLCLCIGAGATEIFHHWDFTRPAADGSVPDSGTAARKKPLKGRDGLFSAGVPLDFPAYTIELKVRLDRDFARGKPQGLFNYEFWSWNRRSFRIRIDRDGRLELFAKAYDGEKDPQPPRVNFSLRTEPLKWEAQKEYAIRVSGTKGETAKIFRDGKLEAAGKNAPGMDQINDGKPREYQHLVRVGWDTSNPNWGNGRLNGKITMLSIRNKADAEAVATAGNASTDGKEKEKYLVVGKDRFEWSAPFDVPDKAGYAYGSREKQESRFINAAARAGAVLDAENLTVEFRCPVPEGLKAKTDGAGLWSADYVEFFLRPEADKPGYFQYCMGTNGKTFAAFYSSRLIPDKKFVSRAKFKLDLSNPREYVIRITIPKSELGVPLLPGSAVTGNFCRGGKTAGGLTSWIPVAGDCHNIDSFGTFLCGDRKTVLKSQLKTLCNEFSTLPGSAKLKVKSAELEKQINAEGDRPERFNALNTALENLRTESIAQANAGRNFLVWRPDVWSNRIAPSMLSKPVQKLKFTAAQNSRVFHGVVFSNLSGKPFLGKFKCFETWPLRGGAKNFDSEPFYSDFQRRIHFSEGLMLHDAGGMPLYDPLLPLPGRTVFRAGAYSDVPVWISISTRGLAPGRYNAKWVIKPATPDFKTECLDIELEVLPVDLAKVPTDSFHYAFYTEFPVDSAYMQAEALYSYLADQEANCLFAGHLREVYPKQNPDGTLEPIDFTSLDRKVRGYIAAGIDPQHLKLMFNLHTFIFVSRDKSGKYRQPTLKFGTPQFERGFKDFIKQLYAHLEKEFNLPPQRVIIYTGDEPEGDINNPKTRLYRVWYLGKLVRQAVPKASTATNPFPRHGLTPEFLSALKKLCDYHNILILIEHAKTPEYLTELKKRGVEIWTYAVHNRATAPESYRRMFIRSFVEGIGSANAYWAIDSYAGDSLDSTDFSGNYKGGYSTNRMDYGTAYVDANLGTVLSGRRAEAHYQGLLDFKALTMCRNLIAKHRDPKPFQMELDAIVRKMSSGNCDVMDQAHVELLRLIQRLQQQ